MAAREAALAGAADSFSAAGLVEGAGAASGAAEALAGGASSPRLARTAATARAGEPGAGSGEETGEVSKEGEAMA